MRYIRVTRLDRVIKSFNEYDKLVQELAGWLDAPEAIVANLRVNKLREEVSMLIGELKTYGC